MNIEIKKNLAKNWFVVLRDIICYEIEELEKEFGTKKKRIQKNLNLKHGENPSIMMRVAENLEF